MTELPPVSVILPSRDRPRLLADTVDSILSGTLLPAELIVIDQSASPNARILARLAEDPTLPLRYLRPATVGVSRARNEGIRQASCPVLAFVDDDCLVAADWLAQLIDAVAGAGPRVVVTGRVLAGPIEAAAAFVPSTITGEKPRSYRGRILRDVLYSGNMAARASAFAAVGWFDERLGPGARFPAAEDNDLCHRLLSAGFEIRYVPTAIVSHRAWRTGGEVLRLRWRYGRGQGAYLAKYRRDRAMRRRLLWALGAHLRAAALGMRSDPRTAAGNLAYLAGLATATVDWVVTQRGGPDG